MDTYTVTLKGLSPLIMHWDNIEWGDQLKELQKRSPKKSVAGDDRSPAITWKGYCYNDGEYVALPHDNLRTCMMAAGTHVGTGKRGATFKRLMPAMVMIEDMFLPFQNNGKPIPWKPIEALESETFADHVAAARKMGFDLLVKRATVGQSKHVRVRPIFRQWSAVARLTILDPSVVSQDSLEQVLAAAGMWVGLGDWRPSAPRCPGPYGRFEARLVKTK